MGLAEHKSESTLILSDSEAFGEEIGCTKPNYHYARPEFLQYDMSSRLILAALCSQNIGDEFNRVVIVD